jgi:hypothetical protein
MAQGVGPKFKLYRHRKQKTPYFSLQSMEMYICCFTMKAAWSSLKFTFLNYFMK